MVLQGLESVARVSGKHGKAGPNPKTVLTAIRFQQDTQDGPRGPAHWLKAVLTLHSTTSPDQGLTSWSFLTLLWCLLTTEVACACQPNLGRCLNFHGPSSLWTQETISCPSTCCGVKNNLASSLPRKYNMLIGYVSPCQHRGLSDEHSHRHQNSY